MKKINLILALFLASLYITAQPTIEWQKSLGGTNVEEASSIQQTTDGGYIVAGYANSNDGDVTGNHGSSDYWVVKISNIGAITWQKSLGGSLTDKATSILQTTDGGYVVAGVTYSTDGDVTGNHGFTDYWMVKLTNTGVIDWQKSLGGTSGDVATSIQQTTDGGYIVAGSSSSTDGDVTGNHGLSDYWVVKLTSNGTIDWQKSLGGTNWDNPISIQQTTDGGYIVVGYSQSTDGDVTGNHGSLDYWVVKITSTGTIVWQKSFGGTDVDAATSVQQTTDEGYIIAGYSMSNDGDIIGNHGNQDYWVVKLDSIGGVDWKKSLGGTSGDAATSIQQTTDGAYIIA
ncbi:MAG: hypothetical protein A3K10_12480 [Bacteroidetes bacterium RIFCSPLOWO2_12_FULL_31_6]|nr:MAG: hypothetical protein A3K10_12480 [Bacteroidetes bacterium RIFCSPLOWO2_12_FULL_31_6]